jgi:hypothetical protein
MTISTKTFQNLQPGVSAADDLRVRTPINQALQWLGEGLPNELNAEFAQISQSVSVQIAAALSGTAGEQTYVEGTFTPTVTFGGGSTGLTYATQSGNYTRIGRLVHFQLVVTLSAKGSSTGDALINGLPVTSSSQVTPAALDIHNVTAGVGDTDLKAVINASATTIGLFDIAAGSSTALTEADFTNNTRVRINGTYIV